jgi:hypothetical protein
MDEQQQWEHACITVSTTLRLGIRCKMGVPLCTVLLKPLVKGLDM